MQIKTLQAAINAYLIDGDNGYYLLPSPITLKPYGEAGILATTKIRDRHYECLRLYINGGSNGQYIISDHGYVRTEIPQLGDDTDLHLLGHDTDELIAEYLSQPSYAHLHHENGQTLCTVTESDFAEKLTTFFRLLWRISDAILRRLHPEYYLYDQDDFETDYEQEPYIDDADEVLYQTEFWYEGQPLCGSDLIDMLPRNPKLREVYQRYCDLRYEAILFGMTARNAQKHARAQIEAELEQNQEV